MDSIRTLSRPNAMPPKACTNAPIELQPTWPFQTSPTSSQTSQTPAPTSLYPAPLFSTPSGSHQANTSKPLSVPHEPTTVEQTQRRDDYLIAQYTSVLEVLETKFLEVGEKIKETVDGSFEEDVLSGVMDSLRAAMKENERIVQQGRHLLWAAFELGGVEGAGVERARWPTE